MRKTNQTDWSVPQRQPASALFILAVQTFWEILKRAWPILIIVLIRGSKAGEGSQVSRFEYYAVVILLLTLAGGLLKYLFFRFYIANDELIVKRGWIKKQTIVIPLNKIQTVNLEQPLLHQAMNLVKITIDTPGSANAEVSIDSLRKPMAEDLRHTLLDKAGVPAETTEDALPVVNQTVVSRLSLTDLLRLSISANHLETFFIILAFAFSLYDNVSQVSEELVKRAKGYIPQQTGAIMLFMIIMALIITIMISSIRIFLKFYNLTVYHAPTGFRITSGLTTIKERVVSSRKVQYISWRANWIRQLLNLRLLRYRLAGDDTLTDALKVELPVTSDGQLEILTGEYHPIPSTVGKVSVTIHRTYIFRKFFFVGVLPAVPVMLVTWQWWEELSLFIIAYPLLVLLLTWLRTRKFKLWAFDEIIFIRQGFFGREDLMLKWHKIQSVSIKQSIHQRQARLANLVITTAGSEIRIRYIPLEAARQIVNYALYKVESSREPWM